MLQLTHGNYSFFAIFHDEVVISSGRNSMKTNSKIILVINKAKFNTEKRRKRYDTIIITLIVCLLLHKRHGCCIGFGLETFKDLLS